MYNISYNLIKYNKKAYQARLFNYFFTHFDVLEEQVPVLYLYPQ